MLTVDKWKVWSVYYAYNQTNPDKVEGQNSRNTVADGTIYKDFQCCDAFRVCQSPSLLTHTHTAECSWAYMACVCIRDW